MPRTLAKYTDKKLDIMLKKDDVGLAPVKSSNVWLIEQAILDLQQSFNFICFT